MVAHARLVRAAQTYVLCALSVSQWFCAQRHVWSYSVEGGKAALRKMTFANSSGSDVAMIA
jgi:hypothetical protein